MIRVLFHLPKQGRHVRQKINGCFTYCEEHDCHVFEGRLLTVDEFHQFSPKFLQSDSYAVRPLVKILDLPDEVTEPEEGAWVPPTQEEVQVLLGRIDGLTDENGKLRSAVTAFESAAVTDANKPAIIEALPPGDEAPADTPAGSTITIDIDEKASADVATTTVVRELPEDAPATAATAAPSEAPAPAPAAAPAPASAVPLTNAQKKAAKKAAAKAAAANPASGSGS